jgi:isocitrate dehydrogenase
VKFADALETVCVSTVEAGFMTKDLSILIGPDQAWQTTGTFLDTLADRLEKALA